MLGLFAKQNYDSKTKLLLHLDNNSWDSSIYSRAVVNNNIIFSNSSPKFNYYGIFNGSNTSLSISNSNAFTMSTDFTIEAWVRFATFTNYQTIFSQYGDVDNRWNIDFDSSGHLDWDIRSGGSWVFQHDGVTTGLSTGTWYHVAFVRYGNTWTPYINGNNIASYTYSGAPLYPYIPLSIGNYGNYTDRFYNGNLDEVRFSNTARYTSNFTPSTVPFNR